MLIYSQSGFLVNSEKISLISVQPTYYEPKEYVIVAKDCFEGFREKFDKKSIVLGKYDDYDKAMWVMDEISKAEQFGLKVYRLPSKAELERSGSK